MRPHSKRVPTSIAPLHVTFDEAGFVDYFRDQPVHVGDIDVGLDVADRPAHVAGDQIQQLLGRGGEAPDSPVGSQDDDRNVDPDQQIAQVVGDLAQFRVAILQLLVQRRQFLVR